MKAAYIIDVARTPVGKYGGALSGIRPDDLLAHIIKALVLRNPALDMSELEDVIAGDANQAGEDTRNVARMASLLAGLPVTVAGNTVNRLCASGLQAIMDCSRAIFCGEGHLYIAAGVESMSRAPFVVSRSSVPPKKKQGGDEEKRLASGKPGSARHEEESEDRILGGGEKPQNESPQGRNGWIGPDAEIYDTTIGWRFTNPRLTLLHHPYSMGETAENIAERWNISRAEQDEYAFHSHAKYFAALEKGIWEDEIVPVALGDNKPAFTRDEHPRRVSLKMLSQLKPAFKSNGSVTAGNASGLNDGSAAMLLASEEILKKYKLRPMARVVSMAVAGVDPSVMGIGAGAAAVKALDRARLSLDDMDIIELNESFAAQSIACIRELHADPSIVNVNGGSLAIGHPMGCSGVRISATLLYEMKRRGARYGLACMCAGLGQGAAIVYENLG
ncbi:MAG TPA: acetyl-CoA C-acyltransferase [Flavitalea sp.]|nr:acetyl-CoA C-acyltransferase [Flavitalea sp.]